MSSTTNKRIKFTNQSKKNQNREEEEEEEALIPGLPDHLSQIPLSLLPPSILFSINHSWRRLLYAPSFPPFPSLYTLLSSPSSSSLLFSSFDPISSTWVPLPPLPSHRPLLLRHPSFIARNLPIQSLSVSNHLVLLAATTHHLLPALSHPLIFNPIQRKWLLGPPIHTPRRWCATASVAGTLFMASGVGSDYNPDVALSAEKWVLKSPSKSGTGSKIGSEFETISDSETQLESDTEADSVCSTDKRVLDLANSKFGSKFGPDTAHSVPKGSEIKPVIGSRIGSKCGSRIRSGSGSRWEKVTSMKNGRFSREAVEGVGWRGRVCMVNIQKEGVIYDMEKDVWEEMPEGMLIGWNGPAAAMDEDVIYVVDEIKGVLSKYVPEKDTWEEVVECAMMKGATKVTTGGGKVCVVSGGGDRIVVVDVVVQQVRIRVVEPPGESRVVAIHVLPRMPSEV